MKVQSLLKIHTYLLCSAPLWSTHLPGLLDALGLRGVFPVCLLPDLAPGHWPLVALGLGGVALGHVLALLFLLLPALADVILHLVDHLPGGAKGLKLGPAHLRPRLAAVLHQGAVTHLDGLVVGPDFETDAALLPEVLLALLHLLGLVGGHVADVTPPVVIVDAGLDFLIFGLLHKHNLNININTV